MSRQYNLIDCLCPKAGDQERESLADFFDFLRLPVPKETQFRMTSDIGSLVLVSELGCSVRVTEKYKMPNLPHPRYLRPLYERCSDKFHMSVNPGLRHHGRVDDNKFMRKHVDPKVKRTLKEEGFESVSDMHAKNYAYMPSPDDGYFVVIDPDTVRGLSEDCEHVRQAIKGADLQGRVFKELREVFSLAETSRNADGAMSDAWDLCREYKQRELLHSAWQEVDYQGTSGTAKRYNHVLQRSSLMRHLGQFRCAA